MDLLKTYSKYQKLKSYWSQVQKPTLFLGFTIGLMVGMIADMLLNLIQR